MYRMRSADHIGDHERRLETEIDQLRNDIRRIGGTYPYPEPRVLFGELFDDEFVEQYYEALVGTLKSAKKRGIISFKGQMLLKGAHDRVLITLLDDDPKAGGITPILESTTVIKPTNHLNTSKHIAPTSKTYSPPDQSDDASVTSYSSAYNNTSDVVTPATRRKGPTKKVSRPFKSFAFTKRATPTTTSLPVSSNTKTEIPPFVRPLRSSMPAKQTEPLPVVAPRATASQSFSSTTFRSTSAPSHFARTELKNRIEEEIPQLLDDIRRIGTPGEPNVLFGDLFDDELVEQYYEALVGTLKSAKKRGYIHFKGQMLLKGMHDKVMITIRTEN